MTAVNERSETDWRQVTKNNFINALEASRSCPILSLNVLSRALDHSAQFVGSLSVVLEHRRLHYVLAAESQRLAANAEVETPELEDM